MGSEKVNLAKDQAVKQQVMRNMLDDLQAFEKMLEMDVFAREPRHLGVEQELSLATNNWKPAPVIEDLLPAVNDEHFTTELARFNMEINLDPIPFTGKCFTTLHQDLQRFLGKAEMEAAKLGAHVVLVGILPTIRRGDVDPKNLTPLKRYEYLLNYLAERREGIFEFRIEGTDQLITKDTHAMFEGCNTSYQVHYQLHPSEFVAAYNWCQAITGPLMAATTNSPLLLGKRLWRETRIALFEQSIDIRNSSQLSRGKMPRVAFGNQWLKDSVLELHKENISQYKIMLSYKEQEESMKLLEQGIIPKLHALNIHNGTIWRWNRPCYGVVNNVPHLRIESRVMPAGPSIVDEVANAAFWLGMMHGMPEEYSNIAEKMDFDAAKDNFFQAAKQGLGSSFVWPGALPRISSTELLLKELIPIAHEGLQKAGVDETDRLHYLGIIEERVRTGKTGSQWQIDAFNSIAKEASKDEAMVATTAGMHLRQIQGKPVHEWKLPDRDEAGHWANRFWSIEQIMTTELFTATEDDIVEYVANIMDWRNIRHVPVENDQGELVGLVSSNALIHYFATRPKEHYTPMAVKEIMRTEVLTVPPEMPTLDAIQLMLDKGIGCLPVVKDKQFLGIVTEKDFAKMSAHLLKELHQQVDSEGRDI